MTIKARIQSRLKRSKRYVFTRDDFKDIAGYDQVGRVLRELVREGQLLKVGYGVYTKARRNGITGNASGSRRLFSGDCRNAGTPESTLSFCWRNAGIQ